MPSAAARRLYEDQIPSFMSVFDLDPETMADRDVVTVVDPKLMEVEPTCANQVQNTAQPRLRPNTLPSDPSHRHNDSTSTQNTESADSSPTTTMSTTDSASLSDPSPSSSPDSPVNLIPMASFSVTPFSPINTNMAPPTLPPPPPTNSTRLERPMTSPSPRRPRNMKGLSIQPVSLNNSLAVEPSPPSFIKPKIPAMKRKPSQLSLKTNSSDLNLRQPTLPEAPQSPSFAPAPILQRRALKHSTSSPHMLSGLKSATFGPEGGMGFPPVLERNESGLSSFLRPCKSRPRLGSFDSTIVEEESPIRAQVANRAVMDFEPFRESENEDQKTPGYPDGPICIYDPNVYLYLEPTAEEAAKFDVVINVAREVRNPFKVFPWARETSAGNNISIPDTAIEGPSFDAGFAARTRGPMADSPTTPKASTVSSKEPEYFHLPWDHNTDIQSDLMRLCEAIEKRTKEGKTVLVHCQQGASRSASLIIAYGMYQNPELSVNDAYYAAQSRSKWISPNMRLMYCLQDFQKDLSKKRTAPGFAFKTRSGRSPTKHHRLTLSADDIEMAPKEPLTAPLPNEETTSSSLPQKQSPTRPRGQSTPNRGEPVSPGPSSAPSTFSWTEKEDEMDPGRFGRFNMGSLLSPPSRLAQNGDEGLVKAPPPPGLPSAKQMRLAPPPPPTTSSSGFTPLQLNLPPASPGFGSFDELLKPSPPSPGFGAHRFGKGGGGVTFGSLNFGKPEEPKAPSQPSFGSLNMTIPEAPKMRQRPSIARLNLARTESSKLDGGHQSVDLPLRDRQVVITRADPDDMALMSPRAEAMTNNPLHENGNSDVGFTGMQFGEVPPTPGEGLFSPRQTTFPRDPFYPFGRPAQVEDPRSPPTKGEAPIVRSIDEFI